MSQLIARINGGAPVTRHADTSVGATLTLDASDRAGWQVPLTKWSIRCSEAEFEPVGWTWDEGQGRYTYTTNAAPPAVTLSERGAYLIWFEPNGAPSGTPAVLIDIAYENGNRAVVSGEGYQFDPINGYATKFNLALAEGLVGPGIGGGASGANLSEPVAWTATIPFDESSHAILAAGAPGALTVAIDGSRPISRGKEGTRLLEANAATSLHVPRSWGEFDDPVSQGVPNHWQEPDFSKPYMFGATAADDGGPFVSFGQVATEQVISAPTIVSRTINSGQLGRLVVVYSVPMWFHDGTDLTTASPARTVAGIFSGDGTATHTYTLSSAVGGGDSPSLTIGASRTVHNVEGVLAPTGTAAITMAGGGGGLSEPALSNLTLDVVASVNNGGISNGVGCAVWTSRSPVTLTLEQATGANRPVLNTTGINGTCQTLDSDGVSDSMLLSAGSSTLSTLLAGSGSDWYVCGVARIDAAVAVTPVSGSAYGLMTGIIVDGNGFWGVFVRDMTGGFYELVAYVFTAGGAVYLQSYSAANALGRFAPGAMISFAVRHDGTNLSIWMGNAVSTAVQVATIACGACSGLGGIVATHKGQGASVYSDIGIHALRVCSTNPSDPDNVQQLAWYQQRLALP